MNQIIVWVFIWNLFWIIFNVLIRWNVDSAKNKYFYRSVYFLAISGITVFYYFEILAPYLIQLFAGFAIAYAIGATLERRKSYYSKFPKDKSFIKNQAYNILFQQSMITSGILLLNQIIPYNTYVYYGFLYMLAHTLIIFASWSTYRFIVLPLTLLAGIFFSYSLINFSNGLIINFMGHLFFYVYWLYKVKDERKI